MKKLKLNLGRILIDGKKLHFEFYDSMNTVTYLAFLSEFVNISVEFFPPYSPELNPTETCWKIIRANVTNSSYFENLDFIQESIEVFLDKHFFMLNMSNYLCR